MKNKITLFAVLVLSAFLFNCSGAASSAKIKRQVPVEQVVEDQAFSSVKNQEKPKKSADKSGDKESEMLLASSEKVNEEGLDDIRGAYIASNGITIDFGFMTQTLVDGVIVSGNFFGQNPESSGQLVQISDNGISVKELEVGGLASFVTIIQNSSDNRLIQQLNMLDIDIKNFQGFRNQSIVPTINSNASFYGQ